MDFKQANLSIHPVETQWHYEDMTKHGFTPLTKQGVGFVRSYEYTNGSDEVITCTTGFSSDYWRSNKGPGGFWGTLVQYLKSLEKNNGEELENR